MALKSTIICFVITLLCLGGISVFIAWIADKMKTPAFTLDPSSTGVVGGFNFTSDTNRLTAAFHVSVRSHNRDPKYSIRYSLVVVSVHHSGYTLAFDSLQDPVSQPHGEDAVFEARPTARNVSVAPLAEDLREETRSGRVEVEVRVRAAVEYVLKGWKRKSYTLKIVCAPLVVNLGSGETQERTECDVDRF